MRNRYFALIDLLILPAAIYLSYVLRLEDWALVSMLPGFAGAWLHDPFVNRFAQRHFNSPVPWLHRFVQLPAAQGPRSSQVVLQPRPAAIIPAAAHSATTEWFVLGCLGRGDLNATLGESCCIHDCGFQFG